MFLGLQSSTSQLLRSRPRRKRLLRLFLYQFVSDEYLIIAGPEN